MYTSALDIHVNFWKEPLRALLQNRPVSGKYSANNSYLMSVPLHRINISRGNRLGTRRAETGEGGGAGLDTID